MAAAPFLAHLDVLRALKGEPKVSYPYGDVDYPVTERVQTLPRLKAAALPFITTPEPDATRFPNNVLVEQIELQCDRTTVEVYRKYERVPGTVLTTYTQDEETQTDVQVDTQIVVKPSAPYTQTAGSSIEYHPINGAYGRKVTSTLLNFAAVSVTRTGTTTIHYPDVVVGSPAVDHSEGEDGAVVVDLQWPILAGGSRRATSTTTFHYGTNPTGVATATATLTGSAVTSIAVTGGGSGYYAAPVVTIAPPGTGATAYPTMTAGVVTSIAVTSGGSGYTSPPVVTITGVGTGATATATLTGGVVTSIAVTGGGSGYTLTPVVTIALPGTTATATATLTAGVVTSIAVTGGGSGYTSPPVVSLNTNLLSYAADAYFTPQTKNLIHAGKFYNVNLRGVAVLSPGVTVPNFNTANDNPKWGYVGVVGPSWTGTPGAEAFLYSVSNIVFSCEIAPWKYNLNRRALTTVTG
jgi:hypothetical protein